MFKFEFGFKYSIFYIWQTWIKIKFTLRFCKYSFTRPTKFSWKPTSSLGDDTCKNTRLPIVCSLFIYIYIYIYTHIHTYTHTHTHTHKQNYKHPFCRLIRTNKMHFFFLMPVSIKICVLGTACHSLCRAESEVILPNIFYLLWGNWVLSIHTRLRQDIPTAIRKCIGKSIAQITVDTILFPKRLLTYSHRLSDIPIYQFFLHNILIN